MIGKTNACIIIGGVTPPPTSGDYKVTYIDIDGTVLKEQWVDSGEDATPPPNPTHDNTRLTFNSWNQVSTNITSDKTIGAIYDTIDGKTYATIRLTTVSGLSPTLYLNKDDNSTLTVDWGDGTTSTFTNSGNFNTGAHNYSVAGDYVITMWISSGSGSYNLGNGSVSTVFVGGTDQKYRETLIKVYLSNDVTSLLNYVFFNSYSLNTISLSPSLTDITLGAFYNCYTLQNINIPTSVTTIGVNTFYSNIKLVQLDISSISTVQNGMFNSCYGLKTLSFLSNVTSIETAAFNNCFGILKYKFYATTPPTLASTNAFTGINSICKIYVPDASLTAYKTATNWVTYANYIYPLSDIGE